MPTPELRLRRGLTVATSFLITLTAPAVVQAAPPADDDADAGAGEDDGWSDVDETPPKEGDGGDGGDGDDAGDAEDGDGDGWSDVEESPPADGETPPDDGGDDDWGDDEEDDWGDDEEDDWDGTLVIEDVSDDPEAAEEEKVEQIEVEGASGTITGVVKDTTNGDPLMGANVRALKTPYEVTTDADGRYTLELPPGTYTLEFYYETFSVKEVSNLTVKEGEESSQSVELTPMAGMTLESEIVAEAPKGNEAAAMTERAESAKTEDKMSAAEMKKSGGGSSASVARRIVGATIVDGRYLFVRGLGHRYGNTLFDGARVPSPEPDLRTVPLDIFPSGALSAINVVKTFTPDQPADFAGASTQLESRDIPNDFILDFGASLNYNTVTTFRDDYIRDIRYPSDAFAFGNLSRGLPKGLPDDAPIQRGTVGEDGSPRYTEDELETYGEALLTHTALLDVVAPPDYGLKATVGDGYSLGQGRRVGWVVSARNSDGYDQRRARLRWLNASDGMLMPDAPRYDYRGTISKRTTQWSVAALGKFTKDLDHEVYLNTFYSRDAESEARELRGTSSATVGNEPIITTRHRYIMRSVGFAQLGGDHRFEKAKNLEFNWFGAFSQARRDDPQIREMLYSNNSSDVDFSARDEFRIRPDITDPSNLSLGLVDNVENGAFEFKIPFKQWKQLDSSFKFGAWAEAKQREFSVRRFVFRDQGGVGARPQGVGNVLNENTIGPAPAPFFLTETTSPSDNYRATQEVFAGFAMLELPFVRWFKVIGGARYEYSDINVESFSLYDPDDPLVPAPADVQDSDFFPSVSLIFSTRNNMNVRLVGTQTIARPEFREIAPFTFQDFVGGRQVRGNPNLVSTNIWNADLRWEWFPSGTEVVAASAFFKYFDNPIEQALGQGPSSLPATFVNADFAINVGGEVEVKKNLQFLAKKPEKKGGGYYPASRVLEDFSLGLNAAYIYSSVRLPEPGDCGGLMGDQLQNCQFVNQFSAATSSSRPLQGQSPWIVNGYLAYENDDVGFDGRLLYNVFGPFIYAIGGQTQPDIYRQPMHTLDLVASQRIFRFADSTDSFEASNSHELRAGFKIGNLLNWPIYWTQDDGNEEIAVERFRKGIDFQVSIEYSF